MKQYGGSIIAPEHEECLAIKLPRELPIEWEGITLAVIGNAQITFPDSQNVTVRAVPTIGAGKLQGVTLAFEIEFRESKDIPEGFDATL